MRSATCHPDEPYYAHGLCVRCYKRQYHAARKKRFAGVSREWMAANRARRNATARRWRWANIDYVRKRDRERMAAKRAPKN